MPRRAHKKSRNGCLECKRRHVKCDENRPVCSNCTASERDCEYGTRFIHANSRPPLATSPTASNASPSSSVPPSATPPSIVYDQPVNMLHAELFHNLYTATHKIMGSEESITWLSQAIGQAIAAPYLANEMLAFSALHLSIIRPHKRDFYHYHAAQLQTQALAIFKETNPVVTQETSIPLFLFSSIIGIHMFCETVLVNRESDFTQFLPQFAHYIRLHHGVRTIINESWSMLRYNPIFQPMLEKGMALYGLEGPLGPGCQKLLQLITAANLGTELTETYRHCIKSLQACIHATNDRNAELGRINGVMTWPILVELDYSELLKERRPEALVILAHFAVLLHRFRDSWLFGDSGRFVIEQVTRYLGEEWEEWLAWPNEVLRSSNVAPV
ncbi:hypothetical protein BJX61DRAFT_545193 [Aspergillus egyptiacus]|nr:hypothetical protein BJX61DRAFT_545193 [Aspergillus egyptiacus]